MVYVPLCMLDSGAYSAWRRQGVIGLDAYMAFIKQNGPRFYSIVALDKIPGSNGQMPETKKEFEEAAAQSHSNFAIMRAAGIDCIPVFHQGEDFAWLERMLDERVPYIGISPYSKAAYDSVLHWLDHVFTRITDSEGRPLCKTHGFGVTGHRIVRRYPWFSVDSTSWALTAAYGNILLPRLSMTGPDYSFPQTFKVSERNSPLRFAPWYRKHVDDYFETLGLSYIEVRRFQKARLRINANYFLGLQVQLKANPFRRRLAGVKPRLQSQRVGEFDYAPKIFLATILKLQHQAKVLTELETPHRLISYYDCRQYDARQIDEYTCSGISVTRAAFRWR